MEAVIIKTRSKSDTKFLIDFAKRLGVQAKTIDTEKAKDKYLVSLIEKGLKTENVNREEIMQFLEQ